MEISNRLPAVTPPAPTRQTQEQQQPTPAQQQSTANTGVTTYVSQGELLQGTGTTDYRDQVRQARQQQVQATQQQQETNTVNNQNTVANRAVEAYQSGGETSTAAAQRQSFNRIV